MLNVLLSGSRKAIEAVSSAVSGNNYAKLENLVTTDCMNSLRREVFEVFDPTDIQRLIVRDKDIFFQFVQKVHRDGDRYGVDLVSYSMEGFDQSRYNMQRMEAWQDRTSELSRRTGYLKREDVNMEDFRKIHSDFNQLNPSTLFKEGEVIVSCYRFEQEPNQEWTISRVGHLFTPHAWGLFRRYKWKGRMFTCIRFKMDIMKVLRYDSMIDLFAVLFFIYLQILAFLIGRNSDNEEYSELRKQERDVARSYGFAI